MIFVRNQLITFSANEIGTFSICGSSFNIASLKFTGDFCPYQLITMSANEICSFSIYGACRGGGGGVFMTFWALVLILLFMMLHLNIGDSHGGTVGCTSNW